MSGWKRLWFAVDGKFTGPCKFCSFLCCTHGRGRMQLVFAANTSSTISRCLETILVRSPAEVSSATGHEHWWLSGLASFLIYLSLYISVQVPRELKQVTALRECSYFTSKPLLGYSYSHRNRKWWRAEVQRHADVCSNVVQRQTMQAATATTTPRIAGFRRPTQAKRHPAV